MKQSTSWNKLRIFARGVIILFKWNPNSFRRQHNVSKSSTYRLLSLVFLKKEVGIRKVNIRARGLDTRYRNVWHVISVVPEADEPACTPQEPAVRRWRGFGGSAVSRRLVAAPLCQRAQLRDVGSFVAPAAVHRWNINKHWPPAHTPRLRSGRRLPRRWNFTAVLCELNNAWHLFSGWIAKRKPASFYMFWIAFVSGTCQNSSVSIHKTVSRRSCFVASFLTVEITRDAYVVELPCWAVVSGHSRLELCTKTNIGRELT